MEKVESVEVNKVIPSPVVVVTVPPTVSELQLIVPAPAIIAVVLPVAAFCIVIIPVKPDTVSVTPELTVKVREAVLVFRKVIELIVALAVTVTLSPGRICTLSRDEGTTPPGHGALTVVEFQLPSPAVVMVACPIVFPAKSRFTISSVMVKIFDLRKKLFILSIF